jgi:hypothetical protein
MLGALGHKNGGWIWALGRGVYGCVLHVILIMFLESVTSLGYRHHRALFSYASFKEGMGTLCGAAA